MSAVQFFTRADLERKLRPYRCRLMEALSDGTELWLTGWNYPFTLNPETGLGEPRYDSWQYQELIATVIARTMPTGFDVAVEAVDRPKPVLVPKDIA